MEQFRTGWFIESVVSASLIVLVVRSRRPFFRSLPSQLLAIATAATIAVTFLVPHLPFAPLLGFGPMPAQFYALVLAVVLLYVVAAELTKRAFYRAIAKGRRLPLAPARGITPAR